MKRTTSYLLRLALWTLIFLGHVVVVRAQGWYQIFGKDDPTFGGVALGGEAVNGGYVLTGYGVRNDTSHLITFQTDLEGQLTQYQEYTSEHSTPARAQSLAVFPDGSFNLLGMYGPGFSVDSTLVIHVGANGQELWRHYLSTSGKNFVWAIEPLAGNECIITGVFENQATFIRLNAAGEEVWRLQQGQPGSSIAITDLFYFALSQIAPGIYAQGFRVDSLPNASGGAIDTVFAVNLAGYFEPVLPDYLKESDDGRRIQRVITQPDGYFLAMSSHMHGAWEIARRINPQGEVIAEYKTSYYDNTIPFFDARVAPTRDGGFIVGGIDGGLVSEFRLRLSKFNAWGHLTWTTDIPFGEYEDASGGNYDIYSVAEGVPGMYMLSGTMPVGSVAKHLLIVTDSLGRIKPGTFFGTVQQDVNTDCQPQAAEPHLGGWRLSLEDLSNGAQRYARTDSSGAYAFQADTAVNHHLQVILPNPYWTACSSTSLASIPHLGDTTTVRFSMQPVVECPFLEVSIGTPFLRRCFYNTYTVQYCNTGTTLAEDAYVRITLDPQLSLLGASLPYLVDDDQQWRFNLGQIPVGFCGSFTLLTYLNCNSTVLGQTHCVEAHIYPDSICLPDPAWSGANVDVAGACQPDSVRFYIYNTGIATTTELDYVVIEDNIINFQGQFTLPAGDSLLVAVPANGHTWRVEAEQEPGNPYNPLPSATVEACGLDSLGGISLGFVSQFGEADGDPFVSIDCRTSIGSFDPNEKFAAPVGYGPEHFIAVDQPLEYQINFQNTGTDTAFYVVIRDTLAAWLDPASIVPGVSSHAYRFEILSNGYLKWTFDHILLPDSNINEVASHGFVKFRIQPRADLPLGTLITNRAGIYFDFNPPVITNTTWHTLGEAFTKVPTQTPYFLDSHYLTLFPNPAPGATTTIFIKGKSIDQGQAEWFNGLGQAMGVAAIRDNQVQLARPLASGVYWIRISSENTNAMWTKWVISF